MTTPSWRLCNDMHRWAFSHHRRSASRLSPCAIALPSAWPASNPLFGFYPAGNQQKVAIAKWLLTDARLFLLSDPTRGIDVGAKLEIYDLMRELTANGAGILFFSTDLSEIVGLCDRALVMYEGAIVRELRARH